MKKRTIVILALLLALALVVGFTMFASRPATITNAMGVSKVRAFFLHSEGKDYELSPEKEVEVLSCLSGIRVKRTLAESGFETPVGAQVFRIMLTDEGETGAHAEIYLCGGITPVVFVKNANGNSCRFKVVGDDGVISRLYSVVATVVGEE